MIKCHTQEQELKGFVISRNLHEGLMENLAFSLSSHAAASSCDALPQLICFTHENDFGPIPAKVSKPWVAPRAKAVGDAGEYFQHLQPPSKANALAAKTRPVDVSSYTVPAPPILLRQKMQRKNVSIKPRVKIEGSIYKGSSIFRE